MRLVIAGLVLFATLAALLELPSTMRSVSRRARGLPPGVYELTLTFFPALLALALVAAAAVFLALLFFGRPLSNGIVPAARAALGVATGVAPWAGSAASDHIVTLHADGLTTLSFDRDPASFVAAARDEAGPQVAQIVAAIRDGNNLRSSDRLFAAADVLPIDTDIESDDDNNMAIWWTWFGAIGLTAFFSFTVTSPFSWFWTALIAISTVAAWVLVLHWGDRAARRRAFGRKLHVGSVWTVRAVLGICVIAAGALFTWGALEAKERSDANRALTATVTVQAARRTTADTTSYEFEGTRDAGSAQVSGEFEDEASFTVGEKVVVKEFEQFPGEWVTDERSGNDYIAPVLKMVGGIAFGGVVYKAYSDVRWARRMERLVNA